MNLSKTAFRPLPADTTAFVRVHSIVYETYLGLQPGTSNEKLKSGDTLAATAESGTDLLEVVQLFDKQAREDLSETLVNVGLRRRRPRHGPQRRAARPARDSDATSRDQLRAATKHPGRARRDHHRHRGARRAACAARRPTTSPA